MGRLIVVSNRLPVRVKVKGRELKIEPSVGGLATGLWIGWPGVALDLAVREGEVLRRLSS